MSKTIAVHPDLFNFSGRNSRKKRPNTSNAPIKVRSPKEKQKTFRKNHVLRFIREEQEKNYKKMMGQETKADKAVAKEEEQEQKHDQFNSSFDESLKYLSQLSKENEEKTNQHNQTLRHHTSSRSNFSNSSPLPGLNNISATLPAITALSNVPPFMQLAPPIHKTVPSWGCLKNGSLPTYRTWRNVTQKNMYSGSNEFHSPNINNSEPFTSNAEPNMQGGTITSSANSQVHVNEPIIGSNTFSSTTERDLVAKEMMRGIGSEEIVGGKNMVKRPKMRYPKQQRTVRRTHKVGKSKVHPKVSVLISNRTIRNNITTRTQLLKQTPIDEVKRYLVKKGFIRVGSSCPNDVLRKMHETSQLMCGEIQNHNPDNLLYNFMNDAKK